MYDDSTLAAQLLERGVLSLDALVALRMESLRRQRRLSTILRETGAVAPNIIETFEVSPSLDEIDVEALGIADCAQCTCGRDRARRVVNTLLVDAFASGLDICVMGEADAMHVYGCDGDGLEELFKADASEFDAVADYVLCLLQGNEGTFTTTLGGDASVTFWAEVDRDDREITLMAHDDQSEEILVELPDPLIEELLRVELQTGRPLSALVEYAWNISAEEVTRCAVMRVEHSCCATRTGISITLPSATLAALEDKAKTYGVPRDALLGRAVFMARELIGRARN